MADFRLCVLDTLQQYAKPGDFIYIDPPYHPVSKYSDFKRYTVEFFYEADQRTLAKTMKELAQQGCYVLVSNSYCDFIFEIYSGCQIFEVSAKRNINKDPLKRGEIKEVLVVCGPYSTHRQSTQITHQLALWEANKVSSPQFGMP